MRDSKALFALAKYSAIMHVIFLTCLGPLGQCDTYRIISVYVMPPKAKASTVVSLALTVLITNFANINDP